MHSFILAGGAADVNKIVEPFKKNWTTNRAMKI